MATESVHPLRISKSTPNSSPSKMSSGTPRPLSELSPTEQRRNSPSWHQPTSGKKAAQNPDSSPFQSSPLESVTSPRMFWQNRNQENVLYSRQPGSPSPNRRSSIERLQRASRVKNSNILALEQKQEYDPTRIPQIERPLAKVQGHSFSGSLRSSDLQRPSLGHSQSDTFAMSPTKSTQSASSPTRPLTPSKDQASPTKSSLSNSRFKSSFDLETNTWSNDSSAEDNDLPHGRSLHRHAKSVTFDAAPPQINEYEMATPDLSSIGTNSREGSYESMDEDEEDDDDEMLYDPSHVDIQDDSFDASLEDTDKTPVVGPDDWRGESPLIQRSNPEEFEHSPMPENTPPPLNGRPAHSRSESVNSNGEHRPLPPLPPLPGLNGHARSQSGCSSPASPAISATAERMLGSHRSLPSPPAATTSKLDIQNIGNGKMSLEERLKLMMLSDDNEVKTAAEQQRERRLRRGSPRDHLSDQVSEVDEDSDAVSSIMDPAEDDDTIGDISGLDDYELPPQISRESIMRRVNGKKSFEDSDYDFSPMPSSPPQRKMTSPERQLPLDPDIPIPSTEDSILDDTLRGDDGGDDNEEEEEEDDEEENEGSVIITRMPEDEDDELDFYEDSEYDEEEEEKRRQFGDTDSESHYSDHESDADSEVEAKDEAEVEADPTPVQETQELKENSESQTPSDEDVMTPRATSHNTKGIKDSLPDLGPATQDDAFSRSFESYMLQEPEKPAQPEPPKATGNPRLSDVHAQLRPFTPDQPLSKPEYDGSGWGEPEEQSDDEPGTPDSVIHNPVAQAEDRRIEDLQDEEPKESPAIPERYATIKSSSGSKLKTRVSNTPSDLVAMREARRHVSREVPIVPPIPARHRDRLSKDFSTDSLTTGDEFISRHPSFKNRSLTLDLDLGLSLDQDFERVIEAQKVAYNPPSPEPAPTIRTNSSRQVSPTNHKNSNARTVNANVMSRHQRGYLMRQNTKLITASDKDTDDAWAKPRSVGNSPVKSTRPQSWTVEPWNPQVRPRSLRKRAGTSAGPIPPLPGQQSNATAVSGAVDEDVAAEMATPDSGERGRLFVKVMGVKDLDLPLPKNERTWFSLTLDNGVHCVTTAWLELARNAPIGQEFELVVPNDLEFQLTLNVKLEKPPPVKMPAPSIRAPKPKASTFSRVFASPKKRKELELRYREEEERHAQQQRDAQARQRNVAPTSYDLLSPIAAEDGSFARAYVCLKEHENRCFGRPYMAEVACFNEWATEEAGFACSVKSKRGNTAVVRKAPYKIGKLELQLLFVPRPKNSTDEDMPKSMNSCIRELKASEERLSRNWEGHLSQQGGDCPYWRRRYFKLVGTKLTAYHEATRQPRATINLSNAKRLIDDRRALTEKETLGRGGKRRRSAFAEDEEGYMFVEEGFRIRFNNGEVIDFYADTAEDKEGWMKVFSEVIGRDSGAEEETGGVRSRAKWCELVLKREEQLRRRASGRRIHSRTKSMYV